MQLNFAKAVLMKKVILMKTFPNQKLVIVNCTRLCMENEMIKFRRTKMKPWHLRMNKVMMVTRKLMNLLQTDNFIDDTKIRQFQVSGHFLRKSSMTWLTFITLKWKELTFLLKKKDWLSPKKQPELPQNPSKISVKLHNTL